MSDEWQRMSRTSEGPRLIAELYCLRDAYRRRAGTIDYAQRRETFPVPELIDDHTAPSLARQLGMPPTTVTRTHLSLFVWELLTGGDALLTGPALPLRGSSRARYRRRRREWETDVPVPLVLFAQAQLARKGIEEPVRMAWVRTLDGSWVETLTGTPPERDRWPGLPPDDQPPGQLNVASPAAVAQYLCRTGSPLAFELHRSLRVAAESDPVVVAQHWDRERALEPLRDRLGQDPEALLCSLRDRRVRTVAQHIQELLSQLEC